MVGADGGQSRIPDLVRSVRVVAVMMCVKMKRGVDRGASEDRGIARTVVMQPMASTVISISESGRGWAEGVCGLLVFVWEWE